MPFKLETDKRGEIYQTHLKEKFDQELQHELEIKSFVANPLPEGRPWIPDLSSKKIIVPGEIVLSTEIRAAQRNDFNDYLRQKEEEENMAKENQQKIQMVSYIRVIV